MKYRDRMGREHRLTRTQRHYLTAVEDVGRLQQGWGGHASTLTVRLLEARGVVEVDWRRDGWCITGLTRLGQSLLAGGEER